MALRHTHETTMLPPIPKAVALAVFTPVVLMLAAASAGAQPGMTSVRYLVLFQQRCASCHGVDGAVPRAASLDGLRAFSPERVYEALTAGSMAGNAAELGDEEKRGLATYVAGKPFGNAVDRSAAAMSNACPSDATPTPASPPRSGTARMPIRPPAPGSSPVRTPD